MQILESLKTNQPLILLSSLTVIIATFLSTNDDQRDAFEYSIYAAFSFFGSFVAAMAYSIIRSDAVHNLVKKISDDEDDDLHGMLVLWRFTFKIATYTCFAIGMICIIIMTYELSSSFPKFGVLVNLILRICMMSLPVVFFYVIQYIQKSHGHSFAKIYKILVIVSLCSGVTSICFPISEIFTGVNYKDAIPSEILNLLLYAYLAPAGMIWVLSMKAKIQN